MIMTNRQRKRARALARQIYSAGDWSSCKCGLSGCGSFRTPQGRADRIINGQRTILKLNDTIIRAAMQMVDVV